MLVNDLASVLRNAGLTVEESAGWTTHNVGQLSAVQTIVIHHTATPASSPGDYPSYNVVKNGRSDLRGPLAQVGIGRSGKAYIFSSGAANHAGVVLSNSYDNYHSIGFEVESPGTGQAWTDAQVHAAAKAAAALCRKFGLPASRVLGHKEVCSPVGRKIDPVGIPGDMAAFRQLVQTYISNPSGGFLMALSDAQQQWMYDAIGSFYARTKELGDPKNLGEGLADIWNWLRADSVNKKFGPLANDIISTKSQIFYDTVYGPPLNVQAKETLEELAFVKSELAAVKSLLESLVNQNEDDSVSPPPPTS